MLRRALVAVAALGLAAPRLALAAPPRFDPSELEPYFPTGLAAEARARFAVEDWAHAAALFADYLKKNPHADDARQARFLEAYALSRLGRFAEAAQRFDELAKSYPLLLDHERLYAARAYAAAKQFEIALARVKEIAPTSPLDGDATLVRADALRQLGRAAPAEAEYKAFLERHPSHWREPEARFRLAELAAADSKRQEEARQGWIAVYVHAPTESWGKVAGERLHAKDPARALTGPEHLERGLALFEAMRNADGEAEFAAALKAGGLDAKQTCQAAFHRAQSAFKARERARAAPLFDEAAADCDKAGKAAPTDTLVADLHMKAMYQGGRCYAFKGETEAALTRFAACEAEHPTHSYADDARLRLAEVYDGLAEKLKKAAATGAPATANGAAPFRFPDAGAPATADELSARATKLLAELVDKYPNGDLRSEAFFRLFFRAWRAGDLAAARQWLEAALAKIPREEGWWDAGRTLYWLGRVADKEGKPDDARASWTRCAKEYPLAYYALAALNRLEEKFPAEAKRVEKELAEPTPTKAELTWTFPPRPLFGEPGFRRGIELARLGLGAEAKRELAAVGIRALDWNTAKTTKVEPGSAEEELLWLAAVLYDRAGDYSLSHTIPRHTLTAHARTWPTGDNKKRWLISYPHGYEALVEKNVKLNHQPEALQFAIIREESAFDPLNESFANAVGLTQLTAPPAARFANGLPHDREALRDPAINLAIGARELDFCWTRYQGNAALAIASYNAGEHPVDRWLKGRTPGETLDEYIEAIPFDETRGYTKRVLSSFFAFGWLYDGAKVPKLANTLP